MAAAAAPPAAVAPTARPWSSMGWIALKLVVIPKALLNAVQVCEGHFKADRNIRHVPSAASPVLAGAAAAAACAVLQVAFAVSSALHLFVRVSQMNCEIMPMA